MISVYFSHNDVYGRIGLEHFIDTYGIILNERDASVNLVYGNKINNHGFNIIVKKNDIEIDDFKEIISNGLKIFNNISNIKNLKEFIYNINFITVEKNALKINVDIFSFIGKCISGNLESFWKNISKKEREELGKVPFIDVYERMLFNVLLYVFQEKQQPFICKAFWPGKKFAVCLTHDVDEVQKTYQWITRPFLYLKNNQIHLLKGQISSFWKKLQGKEPYWTFETIMKIEDSMDVKSSFYFLNEKSKTNIFSPTTWKLLGRRYNINDQKIRKIMKEMHAGGWDIGLHGSYESYNNPVMLEKEKKILQNSLGEKIIGTRQHHLNIDIPKTWEYHEKIGLDYDTTLGFKDQMGFRCGTCMPFNPISNQKRLNLLEIPLSIMDTPLFNKNKSVLSKDFEDMTKIVSEFNGVLTLLWHHAVFNNNEFPGWCRNYENLIELSKKKNAWVANAKEICKWWMERARNKFELHFQDKCIRIMSSENNKIYFINIYLPENNIIDTINNAKILEVNENIVSIQTNSLKQNECVNIKYSEFTNGN